MPLVSRFFGIRIYMYYDDHPPPHFHVRYGKQLAVLAIDSLGVVRGRLTPRLLGLVTEWAAGHQDELHENWRRARAHEELLTIAPLE